MFKQLHVYFSGNVQGVGFRYATRQMANQYRITGWVKNLTDSRVEMLAEGDRASPDGLPARCLSASAHHAPCRHNRGLARCREWLDCAAGDCCAR